MHLWNILQITSPVFIIIVIGFIAVNYNIVPRKGLRSISSLTLNLALPAMLFNVVTNQPLDATLPFQFILIYGTGCMLAFFTVVLITRLIFKRNLTSAAIYGLGGSFSNSMMIGMPVLLFLFGKKILILLATVVLFENIVLLPITFLLAEIGQDKKKGLRIITHIVKTLFKNPLIIAVGIGIAVTLLDIKTPLVATRVIDMLSTAAPVLALFVIGGRLVGMQIKGSLSDITLITLVKLLIHPLIVLLLLFIFPDMERHYQLAAVTLALMPMFTPYAIIAEKYHLGSIGASAFMLTISLSFFSITTGIWLLEVFKPFP